MKGVRAREGRCPRGGRVPGAKEGRCQEVERRQGLEGAGASEWRVLEKGEEMEREEDERPRERSGERKGGVAGEVTWWGGGAGRGKGAGRRRGDGGQEGKGGWETRARECGGDGTGGSLGIFFKQGLLSKSCGPNRISRWKGEGHIFSETAMGPDSSHFAFVLSPVTVTRLHSGTTPLPLPNTSPSPIFSPTSPPPSPIPSHFPALALSQPSSPRLLSILRHRRPSGTVRPNNAEQRAFVRSCLAEQRSFCSA